MPEHIEDESIISTYTHLKATENSIKDLQEYRKELLAKLVPLGDTEFSFNGRDYTATVVTGETKDVNLARLAVLRPDLFAKVSKPVLDTKAFEKSIDAREWDADLIDEVVTITPRASYIRLNSTSAEKS